MEKSKGLAWLLISILISCCCIYRLAITQSAAAQDENHYVFFPIVSRAHINPSTAVPGIAYYVANDGNDSGPGTYAQPWASIARVNRANLSPGDGVLFKRGDSWSGTTLIPQSGTLTKPVIYGAYGTGPKPIIHAGAEDYALGGWKDRNNYRLDNLDFRGGTYAVEVDGANISLTHCNVQDARLIGINAWHDNVDNLLIEHCTVHHNGEQGIQIAGPSASGPTDVTVQHCTVYANGKHTTQDHGIYLISVVGATLRSNTCYDNAGAGIKLREGIRDTVVEQNLSYRNNYGILMDDIAGSPNVVLRNNVLRTNNTGLWIQDTQDCEFYHNTLADNGQSGADYSFGLNLASATCTGNVFKNNIAVQDYRTTGSGKLQPVRCTSYDNVFGNTWDHNLWAFLHDPVNHVANVAGTAYTMAEWQALHGSPDPNSLSRDPNFAADYSDLRLQPDSPAIDAGASLVGLVDDDYVGNPRTEDAFDIGAFECIAAP